MKLQKKKLKILLAGSVLVTYLILSFCAFAQTGNSRGKPVKSPAKEKTVIVNVVNFGRDNPFQPYGKRSIVSGNLEGPSDLPPPPMFDPSVDNSLQKLIEARVNGILYDPYGKSAAIINISGADYMMGKNDSVFGYQVKNITKDKVTLKYGSNTYSVSVGQIVGQDQIKYDPVIRSR